MQKFKWLMLLFLTVILCFSVAVSAKEYFLFDLEKNRILVMGNKESGFADKISLNKKPDLMMETYDPNKFLAVYLPEEKKNKDGKTITPGQAGEMILFDVATGRTEDLVELGFAPLHWAYTADKKEFFITFHPEPSDQVELVHYNIPEMKTEKLYGIAKWVNDIEISPDGKNLAVLTGADDKQTSQVLSFTYAPLTLLAPLPVGKNPEKIYMLSRDRAVVADLNLNSGKSGESSIELINTLDNTLVEERRFKPKDIRMQWFSKEKVLIVVANEDKSSPHKSRVYKVSAEGFRYYEIPSNWLDFGYFADLDCLYVLTATDIKVIDYRNSSIRSYDTGGPNNSPSTFQFSRLLNSNIAVIYCLKNGQVKFFDTRKNMFLKKVFIGRNGIKILNSFTLGAKNTGTVAATNAQTSRFYILNKATRDISVFDNTFKRLAYIVLPEPALAMCQIQKPEVQTIIITEKKIYKIEEKKLMLNPIYEFKTKSENVFLLEEEGRIVCISDREFLTIDPATLTIKEHFNLFGNPDEKYTRLKPGEQRYFFIRSL